MKSSLLLLLALFAALVTRAAENAIPQVTVFGTAVTEAKPDLLRWHLTVSNQGADIAAVAQTHADTAAIVLRGLAEQGIRTEDTQTSGMQLAEHREYRSNSWIKDGYVASTTVVFTMKNLTGYREMWLGLARLNGVTVDQVTWDVSNRITVQNSTRTDALKNAKAKAEQMATDLGVRIAEPISINEVAADNAWPGGAIMTNSVSRAAPQDAGAGEAISPGTVPIRIRVQVAFRVVTR